MTGTPDRDSDAPVLGLLGLGLIGGSLAQSWRRLGRPVVGWSRSEDTRTLAAASGLEVVDSVEAVVAVADIVVLATPLPALPATLDAVAAALAGRDDPPTITDVGSVKGPIVAHALQVLPDPSIFVPGHPMAGTEHAGWASADPELFANARWALAVDEPVDLHRWAEVASMALAVGGSVVPVVVPGHDAAAALVSHLPYALAAALATLLNGDRTGIAPALAAGSFRSATRVVSGDGRMLGAELAAANADELRRRLTDLIGWLVAFDGALASGDADAIRSIFALSAPRPPTVGVEGLDPATVPLDRQLLLQAGRAGWSISGARDGLFLLSAGAAS